MVYITSAPASYRTMFSVPNIALTNIMACYVFRSTRLGLTRGSTPSAGGVSTERAASVPLAVLSRNAFQSRNNGSDLGKAEIEVTKTVESDGGNDYSTPMDSRTRQPVYKGGYIV